MSTALKDTKRFVDIKVFVDYYIDTYGIGKLTISDMAVDINTKLGIDVSSKELEYILSLPETDEVITEEVLYEMYEQWPM